MRAVRCCWWFADTEVVFTVLPKVWEKFVFSVSHIQPSGHIQQIYVLPTQLYCVFCVDLRTNSDYFPIQH